MRLCIVIFASLLILPGLADAQQREDKHDMGDMQMESPSANQQSPPEKKHDNMQGMPGMDHSQMEEMQTSETARLITMHPETFIQQIVRHATSGTTAEPNSTPVPMLMTGKGPWTLMFHASAFLLDLQQSGPRGQDKLFSTNWFMGMAQRALGPGVFMTRAMLSLEPATVNRRQYPLLFQQGELAFGNSITDGQHPHDFFMEIAALYDLKLGDHGLISFYAAPIGDPALGPQAFAHRASASENPQASLGHHQQDSTHIAADVLTVGVTYRAARIEASGFHGREPDENRWNIDQGKIDSWSTRLTIQPGRNWSGQFSYGRLTSPEARFPFEDQERMTASVMYNHPFPNGNWASTMIWGRTRSLQDDAVFNSYTFESTARFWTRHHAWTRIENADRSNELILGKNPPAPNFQELPIGPVKAYTFGYDYDFDFIPHVASAIGAQVTAYGVGNNLRAIYGSHPAGVAIFMRFRPFSEEAR